MSNLLTKLLVVVPVGVLAAACVGDKDNSTGDPLESPPSSSVVAATIESLLEVDGCKYVIDIDGVRYAPDETSRAAIVDNEIPFGRTQVGIRYRVTGNTAQAECGFSGYVDFPEISFTFATFPTEP